MPTGMYFPTCIYTDEIKLLPSKQQEFVDYLYQARNEKNDPFRSMSSGGFTSFNTDDRLHRNPLFGPLFSQIARHAETYARDLGADVAGFQPGFLNSWGNIYPTGEYVRQHNHANSVISGVYYLSCPPGTGGTYFVTPLEYARAMDFPHYVERNMKNFEEIYFEEQPFRLIMFPGWLKHYTEANQSQNDRVILSFNFNFYPPEQLTPGNLPATGAEQSVTTH